MTVRLNYAKKTVIIEGYVKTMNVSATKGGKEILVNLKHVLMNVVIKESAQKKEFAYVKRDLLGVIAQSKFVLIIAVIMEYARREFANALRDSKEKTVVKKNAKMIAMEMEYAKKEVVYVKVASMANFAR
jgi:hypothetical protein